MSTVARRGALAAILFSVAGLPQTVNDFFDDRTLHELRFVCAPADWQRLKATFGDNTYYPCDMTWRNVTVENLGIRSSGLGSRNPIKPALRVDLDRFEPGQRFLGLKSIKLDNLAQDASGVKERATAALARRMGLPASLQTHAKVYMNGEFIGLYGVIESVDKAFLKRNFNEDDGYLYEYKWSFSWHLEYLGSDPGKYSPAPLDPHTHEKDPDPRPLEELVRAVNQCPESDFVRCIGSLLDPRKFLTHLALETYMAEVDGILGDLGMANFYLYRFEKKKLHQFILWDKDNTFSNWSRPILQNASENVLTRKLLAAPEMRDFFLGELFRAATLAGGPGGFLEQEVTRDYAQIRDGLAQDPNKQCPDQEFKPGTRVKPCTMAQVQASYDNVLNFSQLRSDFVLQEVFFAGYQPSGAGPRLSEGGAVNAASSAPGLVAGSLASIYGEGLANATAAASSLPLPTSMGGVTILINGAAAPLLFVSPGQVNLQVPWTTPSGTAALVAVMDGVPGNTITAPVRSALPGVFVVVNAAGQLVNADRPARAGDVLIVYATGLGAVTESQTTGRPAPASPLASTRETPVVRIGNVQGEILFAGLTPGFVGLYQLNTRLGAGTPAGAQTGLTVSVGSQTSPAVNIVTR